MVTHSENWPKRRSRTSRAAASTGAGTSGVNLPQGDFRPTTPPKDAIPPKFRIVRDSGAAGQSTSTTWRLQGHVGPPIYSGNPILFRKALTRISSRTKAISG